MRSTTYTPMPGGNPWAPAEPQFAGPLHERVVDAPTRVMLPWVAKLCAAQGDKLNAFRFDPWEGLRMAQGPRGWSFEQMSLHRLDAQLAELVGRRLRPDPPFGHLRRGPPVRRAQQTAGPRWPGLHDNGARSRRLALQWAFAVRFALDFDDPLVRRAPQIWRGPAMVEVGALTVQPALATVALAVAGLFVAQIAKTSPASAVLAVGVGLLGSLVGATGVVAGQVGQRRAQIAALLAGCQTQDQAFADLLFYHEAPELDPHAFLRTAFPNATAFDVGAARPSWPPKPRPSAPGYRLTASEASASS